MRKLLALTVIVVSFLGGTNTAQAHLVVKPKGETLKHRLESQKENLAHAKYVCNKGGGKHKAWACKATAWLEREYLETKNAIAPPVPRGTPQQIICMVFKSQCQQALRVARCEGNFNPYAQNGQYLGTFQMGSYARSVYGHGWTIYEQAVAAYRYYLAAGWSPWQCSPYGGLQW